MENLKKIKNFQNRPSSPPPPSTTRFFMVMLGKCLVFMRMYFDQVRQVDPDPKIEKMYKKCLFSFIFINFLLPEGLNFGLNGFGGWCLPKGSPKKYRIKTFLFRQKPHLAPPAQPHWCGFFAQNFFNKRQNNLNGRP